MMNSKPIRFSHAKKRRLVDKMPALAGNVMETLCNSSPDRSMNWFFIAVATAIGGLIVSFWARSLKPSKWPIWAGCLD